MDSSHPLKEKQVSTEVTRAIIAYLESQKLDLSDLSQKTKCSYALFIEPDHKVPIYYELQLWHYAVEKTNNPHLGLTLAKQFDLQSLGVMGYLATQQSTVGAMLTTYSHYHRMVHEEATIEVISDASGDVIEHYFSKTGEGPGQAANEMTLGTAWCTLKQIAAQPLVLQKACFQHRAPNDLSIYSDFFGQPVQFQFSQLSNKLVLAPHSFSIPLKKSDHRLAQILKNYADQALASLPTNSELESALYRTITELLSENLHIDTVAEKLGMSRRTLQRRLSEKKLTFRHLVEDVQKRCALRYLEDMSLSITEVAYVCGFSELSPFSRAFKRWTGMSPKEFRDG